MSRKKQDRCFVGQQGHLWMHVYDYMHPWARQLLAGSKYNICAACFQQELDRNKYPSEALAMFEERIRCEETV